MNVVWRPMAKGDSQPAVRRSSYDTAAVQALEQQVDRLEMICEAMWELLRDKVGESDESLMAKILELDLSDGSADGKVQRGPAKCANCDRPNSRRHEFCIYCGQPLRNKPFG